MGFQHMGGKTPRSAPNPAPAIHKLMKHHKELAEKVEIAHKKAHEDHTKDVREDLTAVWESLAEVEEKLKQIRPEAEKVYIQHPYDDSWLRAAEEKARKQKWIERGVFLLLIVGAYLRGSL